MEQQNLNLLLDKAKTDKNILKQLKKAAVDAKLFELAANLRGLEMECFPESDAVKYEKSLAQEVSDVFRLGGMDVDPSSAWLAYRLSLVFSKKKMNFKLSDATELIKEKDKIFN